MKDVMMKCEGMFSVCKNKDLGLLVLRLAIGAIFIAAGYAKLSMIENVVGFFGQLGLAPFFAWFVSIAELVGGLLLVLGFFTEIALVVLGAIMLYIIAFVHVFSLMSPNGIQLPLALLGGIVAILCLGVGKYSVRSQCCDQV